MNRQIKEIFEVIIKYLLNKNVLAVGSNDYFNLFELNYGDKFNFVYLESLEKIENFDYDLIIDNKHKTDEFKLIYGEKTKICSFID